MTILKYIRMSGFGIPAVCLLELHDKRQTFLVRGALVHPNAVKAMSLNDSGHVLDRSSGYCGILPFVSKKERK
jgi:hypothetical protein